MKEDEENVTLLISHWLLTEICWVKECEHLKEAVSTRSCVTKIEVFSLPKSHWIDQVALNTGCLCAGMEAVLRIE